MSRSVISLDIIASDICGDLNDPMLKYKFRVTRHLLNGYRRMNMFLSGQTQVKTAILDFSNVINLPCDFQYVTKVGVRRAGSSCIAILSVRDNVERRVLNDTDTCNYLNNIWSGAELGPQYAFYNAWTAQGNYYGELYGMGRGVINSGTYSIDKGEGIIYIGSNVPPDSEVIVEYVGNGISNGVTMVPMELKECLEFYAKWKFYADNNPRLGEMNYDKYKKEYNVLKRYYNHRTPLQIAVAVNSAISPTNY